MQIKKDEKLWMVPTCYWLSEEPELCIGIEDAKVDSNQVLVFLDSYGHNTYVMVDMLFHLRENAIKTAEALTILKNAKDNDTNSEFDIDAFIEQVRNTVSPK